jgi:SprT protein
MNDLLTIEECHEYIGICCEVCDTPQLRRKISLEFNNRFSARMGDALWDGCVGRIRLSAPLFHKASIDERIETVVHETCHVIAYYKFGRCQPHGRHWKEMMERCGYQNPRRCHSVDLIGIVARRTQRSGNVLSFCGCEPGFKLMRPDPWGTRGNRR